MSTDLANQIDDLQTMTTSELAELYEQLHGQPCRTRHRAYLIRKNAWRIQANAEGGLSERARKRAMELANDADVRVMAPKTLVCPPQPPEVPPVVRKVKDAHPSDPRLPAPGSAIVRRYKGKTVRVIVLKPGEGFECDGERYRTLSAVAKAVTGTHINGFRFFGLQNGGAR
ncbi:MAG: DUF2924 domain-containing protein [Planctomycetota bacterium]